MADVLSRLFRSTHEPVPFEDNCENHALFALDTGSMDICLGDIEAAADEDEELKEVINALKYDKWPRALRKYEAQKNSLHHLGSLVCKDDRIVLPSSLRRRAMEAAHGGHVGQVAMKRIMREFFWWPRMASETEQFVKDCQTCCMLSRKNPPLPISSRDLPGGPWEIVQTDFLSIPGYGSGDFLTVVDTYSRYLSVVEMKRKNADSTNAALIEIFRPWGCPRILQSDNGPPFNSSTFCSFWENKGVNVRKSIPLSPQSNGLVERQNQSIIKAISASTIDGSNWRRSLETFVHNHNTLIPHARLKVTPFELLVGFKYRGQFPSLWDESQSKELDRENIRELDAEAKLYSKHYADEVRGAKESGIKVGDVVLLSQQRNSKSDPMFSSERFTVITRVGAKVVVVSGNGVQYTRNVQDVKLAPSAKDLEISDSTAADEVPLEDAGMVIVPDCESDNLLVSPAPRNINTEDRIKLRQRSNIKRPARLNDNYVYSIYQ